jgi:multicomponent Na+:H+ antiporter subunit A
MLAGFIMLGQAAGGYAITDILASGYRLRSHPDYHLILVLILAGAFTKSAQFPFHFWLPNAMSAPTPISAFLHSATMVKAGVYLLARLHPVLGGTTAWMAALVVTGAVTALIGSVLAMGQRDLKRVLAYTTVMALGIITMFLGGPTTPALTAAVTFLLVHALYKSALFLVVGSIDHEAGTRRLDRLGGLARTMPLTAAGAAAAALSMAGFPLFLGFVGKEIMYKGALTEEMFAGFATTAALLSNALMTAVAGVILIRVFLSGRVRSGRDVHEAPPAMWIGPLLLGGLGLVFGIIPEWVGTHLVEPAVYAIHSTTEDIQLKLWHGVNMPLLLSVATLTLGGLIYGLRERIRDGLERVGGALPWSLDRLYGAGMDGLAAVAAGVTRRIQTGSLSAYLTTVFFAFIAAAGYGALRHGLPEALPGLRDVGSVEGLVALAMVLAAVVVVSTASRLLAVCGLGVVGAGAAVFFLVSGAPDVAMTQLLVETLTLVIVAMVLLRLPRLDRAAMRRRPGRGKDLLTAVLAGALVGGLLLAVTAVDLDRSLTAFYESRSAADAHGRNIVNVILVDFRGLDTLGEITVVAAAGLAAVALIRGSRRRAP